MTTNNCCPEQENDVFGLVIGADHSSVWQWGTQDDTNATLSHVSNGCTQVYLDKGITPYLAIITDSGTDHSPTGANGIGWDRVRSLQNAGVEILSHSHSHFQRWDRLCSGIYVNYSGAGVGTMLITATSIVLTGAGGTDDLTITRSSLTTLNDVIAAINAVPTGNWQAAIQTETALLGTESQTMLLPISAARNVKGSPAAQNRYFCAAGGLWVDSPRPSLQTSTSNQVESFFIQIRNNGYLEVMINGIREAYINLLASGYTFTNLANDLNSTTPVAGVRTGKIPNYGIRFWYADNGGMSDNFSFRSYMRGDELASALFTGKTSGVAWIAPPGNINTPIVIEAGLSQRYIRDRQFQQNIDIATANGVTLKGFAEPGNYWYPHHQQGHDQFAVYRGTIMSLEDTGLETFAISELGKLNSLVRSMPTVSLGFSTPAHMIALADAMADSSGHACNILIHELSPLGGGSGTYDLGTATLRDQNYANMAAFLDRVNVHMANGKIANYTPTEIVKATRTAKSPRNWIFNPKFKTSGMTMNSPTSNDGFTIPGWRVSLSGATGASISIDADGYAVINSPTGVADAVFEQAKTIYSTAHEYGMLVDPINIISGLGAWVEIRRGQYGHFQGHRVDVNSVGNLQMGAQTALMLTHGMAWSIYNPRKYKDTGNRIKAVSSATWPVTITPGVNDQVQFVFANGGPSLTAPTSLGLSGSVTAYQVADAINAIIDADASMRGYPEYYKKNFFSAEKRGRSNATLIAEFPEHIDQLLISGSGGASALTTIWGGTGGDYYRSNQPTGYSIDPSSYTHSITLRVNVQGTIRIGRPFLKPSEAL